MEQNSVMLRVMRWRGRGTLGFDVRAGADGEVGDARVVVAIIAKVWEGFMVAMVQRPVRWFCF